MNKLKEILAKLEGKTVAEQVALLKAELTAVFQSPEAAAGVTPADLSALNAKLTDLSAKLDNENRALSAAVESEKAKTAEATKVAASATAERDQLKNIVASNPAFAHAAAGHQGAAPGGGAADRVEVVGTMVDTFHSLKAKTVNGNKVACLSAEAVRFFEKNEDSFRAMAAANHPAMRGFGINAALTSTGTTTSNTGLAYVAIAIKTIRSFGASLLPFKAFTTDFSAEDLVGTTITPRIVPLSSGAGDLNSDYSGSYLGAAKTLTTTPITIDMTGHPIDGFSITPDQFQNIASGVWPVVAENNLRQKVYAVSARCLKQVFDLLTAANYSQALSAVAPSNLDSVYVGNAAAICMAAGFQPEMMSLVLNALAYAGLGNDPLIANYMASQTPTLRDGKLPMVKGFNTAQAVTLPYAGTTPATEKLIGFACMPGALAIGMRPAPMPPQPQLVPGLIMAETVEDPATGAILTISQQIDPDTRSLVINVEAKFGCAKGDATQLFRIPNV